ncbi:MAG TPA: hypothetical protein VGA88_00880 [Burkholderiales bacterium]
MDLLGDEKLFYERFYALHRDPALMKVFERFGIEAFRRSSVLEGFDAFLRAHEFNGDTCVEIGTYNGLTAIVLARYFRRVVTIDIVDQPQKYEIAAFLGINNISFVNVPGNSEKASVIGSLSFDAAYVDGDHARDTFTDFALVCRCRRVMFHEAWPAQPLVEDLLAGLRPVVRHGKFALWQTLESVEERRACH